MHERWQVFKDGRAVVRDVDIVMRASLLEMCPECAQLCSGRYRFWFEYDETLFMVDVDQPTIDACVDELSEIAEHSGDHGRLPSMVRALNDLSGWADDLENPFGCEVGGGALDDFVRALRVTSSRTNPGEVLDALHSLVADAAAIGAPVYAMND